MASVTPSSSEVATLAGSTLIGGWNLPFRIGIQLATATTSTELHLTPTDPPGLPVIYPLSDLISLEFCGPGLQVHGGGFFGGGFGLKGAAEGIIAAGLLNRLTTKTTVNTQINIVLKTCGLMLHSSRATPERLRIKFLAAAGRTAAMQQSQSGATPASERPKDAVSELERLYALHKSGALTAEEYNLAKVKLLST